MKIAILFAVVISVCITEISADARKPLNSFIRHHETLNYDVADVHYRSKRALDMSPHADVSIKFKAHNKDFRMHLQRNHFIFGKDFKIVDGFGNAIPYDYSRFVHGDVEGHIGSYVIGKIDNGRFEGSIHLKNDRYHIEPAERYFGDDNTANHHSVIYRQQDVEHDAKFGAANIPESPSTLKESSLYKKMESENNSNGKQRQRRGIKNRYENTCNLALFADHLFLKKFVRRETAIDQMVLHYQAVEYIFRNQTFDTNGQFNSTYTPQSIGFRIKEVRVWNDDSVPKSLAPVHISVDKLLENFSQMNHSSACLAYLFTDRSFDDGVMGLAYIANRNGNPDMPGGICDPYKEYDDGIKKNFNTGVVSFQLYNREVPSSITEIAFAHQLGHSFGAEVKQFWI